MAALHPLPASLRACMYRVPQPGAARALTVPAAFQPPSSVLLQVIYCMESNPDSAALFAAVLT